MGISFRALKAEEVECRIGQIAKNGSGLSLLLFKTARTDMDILDETVGSDNWQCKFYERKGTLFCSTGIRLKREDGSYEWVWKDDAGSPSNMEAAKGEASDCRKRSGVCWGIGRELYTAPRIWIYAQNRDGSVNCNIKPGKNGKPQCYDEFSVSAIEVENHVIRRLEVRNDTNGRDVFEWPEASGEQTSVQLNRMRMEINRMIAELSEAKGVSHETVANALYNSAVAKANGIAGEEGVTSIELADVLLNQLRKWSESIGGRQ